MLNDSIRYLVSFSEWDDNRQLVDVYDYRRDNPILVLSEEDHRVLVEEES